ncbi:hypothetical protein OWV82_001679 [Melia azedarach]|uniref:Uncharacterized protein n=1 Tax=Melia azedarach TaxID=155640 RepID=A0ACC1YYD6_MELAZ|nr:hypothetical protein OWV82_001679 [Melia azedarach]
MGSKLNNKIFIEFINLIPLNFYVHKSLKISFKTRYVDQVKSQNRSRQNSGLRRSISLKKSQHARVRLRNPHPFRN